MTKAYRGDVTGDATSESLMFYRVILISRSQGAVLSEILTESYGQKRRGVSIDRGRTVFASPLLWLCRQHDAKGTADAELTLHRHIAPEQFREPAGGAES